MLKHYEITIGHNTYEGEARETLLQVLHKAYEVNSSEVFTLIDADNDKLSFRPYTIDFLYISDIKYEEISKIGY